MLARALSQCRLFEIPLEVFELSGLLSLDVAENELSTLSPLIANFSQLQTLHCEENNLKQLPVRRARVCVCVRLSVSLSISLSLSVCVCVCDSISLCHSVSQVRRSPRTTSLSGTRRSWRR